MKRITAAFGMCLALMGPLALSAQAAPCRDAKGKFVSCPPPKAAKTPCRDAKGKFVACTTAATPK